VTSTCRNPASSIRTLNVSTRAKHAAQFRDALRNISEEDQPQDGHADIERRVENRQRLTIHDLGGDAGKPFRGDALSQSRDHSGREVRRQDLGPGTRGHETERTRSGSDVDHSFPGLDVQQPQSIRRELRAQTLERLPIRRREGAPSFRHLI
jgi:hypothetical protein